MCVLKVDANKRVVLNAIPFNASDEQYMTERDSVQARLTQLETGLATRQSLEAAQAVPQQWAGPYETLQTRYAAYTGSSDAIEKTLQTLKPLRPRVAPAEDLSLERRFLLQAGESRVSPLVLQVALFLIVLSLLSYLVFSPSTAHMVTFLLLSVGIAAGFFLRK